MSSKGYKQSEEHKIKIGLALKGNKNPFGKHWKLSKDTCHKMSNSKKGKPGNNKGKHWKVKDTSKMGMKKEKHYNWKGGISENPYPKEFNSELKLKIRTKYNFTCCLCGKTEREEIEALNRVLCVNHIDFDKQNCREENLNVLCLKCNIQINREREYYTNLFNQ
jgi:hypothetical protein